MNTSPIFQVPHRTDRRSRCNFSRDRQKGDIKIKCSCVPSQHTLTIKRFPSLCEDVLDQGDFGISMWQTSSMCMFLLLPFLSFLDFPYLISDNVETTNIYDIILKKELVATWPT